MADKQRQLQIAEEIRAEAGNFFSAKPPANTLVTVTKVEMSPDLSYADLFISIMPADKKDRAMDSARSALPGLRRQIGNSLKMRKVPQLRLEYDNRSEAQARVSEILDS